MVNPPDVICVDVPLMIRLLEYAREDAKTDMDLHNLSENLIKASGGGKTLSMDDYDSLVPKADDMNTAATQRVKALAAATTEPLITYQQWAGLQIRRVKFQNFPDGRYGNYSHLTEQQNKKVRSLLSKGWAHDTGWSIGGKEFPNAGSNDGVFFERDICVLVLNKMRIAILPSGAEKKVTSTWKPTIDDFKD